jgi:hypothetical protein
MPVITLAGAISKAARGRANQRPGARRARLLFFRGVPRYHHFTHAVPTVKVGSGHGVDALRYPDDDALRTMQRTKHSLFSAGRHAARAYSSIVSRAPAPSASKPEPRRARPLHRGARRHRERCANLAVRRRPSHDVLRASATSSRGAESTAEASIIFADPPTRWISSGFWMRCSGALREAVLVIEHRSKRPSPAGGAGCARAASATLRTGPPDVEQEG